MNSPAPSSAHAGLVATLPALQRLALAYAPAPARMRTLALFALDARLADIVRRAKEPALGQLRLAWWRELLGQDRAKWPCGDPLVSLLAEWGDGAPGLAALVDGWEWLAPGGALARGGALGFAQGRAAAFAALAGQLGHPGHADAVHAMAARWALQDLSGRLGNGEEAQLVRGLVAGQDWAARRLPRDLRPLTVLHGLAARSARKGAAIDDGKLASLAAAMRLGLFGF